MKETNNPFIPDYQMLLPIPENISVRVLLNPPEYNYQDKGKEVLPINKSLPPDHLTATYWG